MSAELERLLLLELIERRHQDVELVIEMLGVGDKGERAWWLRGAAGYHEGTGPGRGGTGWTKAEAGHHVEGWEAAAKWDGNHRVLKDEVPPEGGECDQCLADLGDYHVQGCYHLEPSMRSMPREAKAPVEEQVDLQETLEALWESLADGVPFTAPLRLETEARFLQQALWQLVDHAGLRFTVKATGDFRARLHHLHILQEVEAQAPRPTLAIPYWSREDWLRQLKAADAVTTIDDDGVERPGVVKEILAFGQLSVEDERGLHVFAHASGHQVPDVGQADPARIEPDCAGVAHPADEPGQPLQQRDP